MLGFLRTARRGDFARIFRSSIVETGRRNDMVRNDGFSLLSFVRLPACQWRIQLNQPSPRIVSRRRLPL
jgi:hypothetical protein